MDKATTHELLDFISHHYIDIDAEVVFDICIDEVEKLEVNILKLKNAI
ncbi:MAG: hypothetical protein U9Q29_08100 [Campylobacterota bacterium]|nr:hypothetical protein [Campylobacterota bacterium]